MTSQIEKGLETLAQELARLIGEYQDDDAGDATKEEAWNCIADFTIDNGTAIVRALTATGESAGSQGIHHEAGSNPAAVKLDGHELWEIVFGVMEGDVPEELTDAKLEEIAQHIRCSATWGQP